MTYNLIVSNSIAQEVNYKDIAIALGWKEGDENETRTWQQVVSAPFRELAMALAIQACNNNELLNGRLNYNADAMIQLFSDTTNVEFVEVE